MSTKRYKDGDRLHAGVFNKLLNDVENLEYDVDELKKKKDNNTWRPIKVNNKDILGKEITTPLNLLPGDGVTIEHDNNGNVTITNTGGGGGTSYIAGDNIEINGNVISAVDTTYAASDFDIKDLADTTGLRGAWSNKQDTIDDLDTIRNGATLGATALQSFTETDPTVPAWAKTPNKPTYTAQEVGALPSSTTIPTKTSELVNDSGFVTGATTYSAGTNIEITGTGNSINALGYVYDATKFSFATGLNTTASGNYSHAEGSGSEATNEFSHAEGNGVHATGPASHAEGSVTWANGNNSHAEGIGTIANGWCSHTEGDGTETSETNFCEHAEGRFNASHTGETDAQKTRHSIGIGSDPSHRANAFEVMANGDVYINGVGGYDGTNPASAQTVSQAIPTKTSDLTNDSGYITGYTLPIASTSGLGGVKIGNGLEIDSTGVVNVVGKQDVLTAGNNIEITSGGTISATNTTYVASDFDVKDLADTTGLREEWSNKQNPIYVSVDDVINFLNNDAI